MKVGKIIEIQQPGMHKKLNKNIKQNNKKRRRGKKEDLSFSDYVEMMKHDSYRRHKGALRQK
ncbi:hypothetical protein NE169_15480 [Clostridium botulinum]|uniref:hypothetical protein n=1 Tax=Clostridium botulinum TaxID=1491 RepID=UPI002147CF29|nr:hypothetical protein [Clostridium botulinum]MCR1166737.1 hypothetical protein [Clostridium botulinum]